MRDADTCTLLLLNSLIDKLEQGVQRQNDIDIFYDEWCDVLKHMYNNIAYKSVNVDNHMSNNRKRRQGKPWWNEHLSLLWVNMCTAEKYWLKSVSKCQQAVLKSK